MTLSESDASTIVSVQELQARTGPHQVQLESWTSCAPFERLLHMEIVDAADGQATLKMPFLLQYAQGAALMHGGALMSLADTALVMAIKSILPPHTHFVTVHAKADFLRAVTQGIVTARAQLATPLRRKISGEARVFNDEGDEVLRFEAIFVIPGEARDEQA